MLRRSGVNPRRYSPRAIRIVRVPFSTCKACHTIKTKTERNVCLYVCLSICMYVPLLRGEPVPTEPSRAESQSPLQAFPSCRCRWSHSSVQPIPLQTLVVALLEMYQSRLVHSIDLCQTNHQHSPFGVLNLRAVPTTNDKALCEPSGERNSM